MLWLRSQGVGCSVADDFGVVEIFREVACGVTDNFRGVA
jgi:hypothetical protein